MAIGRRDVMGFGALAGGLMGWAGWLGSSMEASQSRSRSSGFRELEDATRWELSFFKETLRSVEAMCPRNSRVLYHYTDLESAKAILKGHQGIRLSRGGYRGGGVFFSRRRPTDAEEDPEKAKKLWGKIFPLFRAAQLRANYGKDFQGRERQADAVLVCFAPHSMVEDLDLIDRSGASFISLERFETFDAEYFAIRNIPRAYRLAPAPS
ncbi:unnamed protein product [Effrenium voratum]|uniref:Uncharacterized protein n=1 Tax=Effrenium voratum TaxID=2562239 RepID=A0AA36IWQ6_9DINO|nr:unnamed protein product [Effrenium voratum]